jgi:hypothetical protein
MPVLRNRALNDQTCPGLPELRLTLPVHNPVFGSPPRPGPTGKTLESLGGDLELTWGTNSTVLAETGSRCSLVRMWSMVRCADRSPLLVSFRFFSTFFLWDTSSLQSSDDGPEVRPAYSGVWPITVSNSLPRQLEPLSRATTFV